MTPEQHLDKHDGKGYLSLRTRALMAMEDYSEEMAEAAFNYARDRLFNPDGTFREYRFVNYQHYYAFIKNAKELTDKKPKNNMQPEQKQALIDILNGIVTALYPTINKEEMDWLYSKIDILKKPSDTDYFNYPIGMK